VSEGRSGIQAAARRSTETRCGAHYNCGLTRQLANDFHKAPGTVMVTDNGDGALNTASAAKSAVGAECRRTAGMIPIS